MKVLKGKIIKCNLPLERVFFSSVTCEFFRVAVDITYKYKIFINLNTTIIKT